MWSKVPPIAAALLLVGTAFAYGEEGGGERPPMERTAPGVTSYKDGDILMSVAGDRATTTFLSPYTCTALRQASAADQRARAQLEYIEGTCKDGADLGTEAVVARLNAASPTFPSSKDIALPDPDLFVVDWLKVSESSATVVISERACRDISAAAELGGEVAVALDRLNRICQGYRADGMFEKIRAQRQE